MLDWGNSCSVPKASSQRLIVGEVVEGLAYFPADAESTKPIWVGTIILSVCGKALRNEVHVAAEHTSQRLSGWRQ